MEGAKRDEIIDAATRRFGRDGYENTRWADIASDVGVSPTALYHYQDSFRLTDQDIQRNRVLVAEQGLLMNQRESPGERSKPVRRHASAPGT